MKKLDILRKKIDLIDKNLIYLLEKRQQIVEKIGILKKKHKFSILDKKRWKQVLNTRSKWALDKGMRKDFIKNIFELIHDEALKIENKI